MTQTQTLTHSNRASWLETIWDALHSHRDNSIPEGDAMYDREWDEICTAMHWIMDEMGMEATEDGITDLVRDGAQCGHNPAQTALRVKLDAWGFESGSTGGGCEGATLELPDEYLILISDEHELAAENAWGIDASRDGEPIYFTHNQHANAPATIRDAIECALVAIYEHWLDANSLSAMCADELRSELLDDAAFYARKDWREKWTEVDEQIVWLEAFIEAWNVICIKAH